MGADSCLISLDRLTNALAGLAPDHSLELGSAQHAVPRCCHERPQRHKRVPVRCGQRRCQMCRHSCRPRRPICHCGSDATLDK
jgi:hypothetical protein